MLQPDVVRTSDGLLLMTYGEAIRAYDAALRQARAALEAGKLDETRACLQAASDVHGLLQRQGFYVQPELFERLQVLQFAAARGFL